MAWHCCVTVGFPAPRRPPGGEVSHRGTVRCYPCPDLMWLTADLNTRYDVSLWTHRSVQRTCDTERPHQGRQGDECVVIPMRHSVVDNTTLCSARAECPGECFNAPFIRLPLVLLYFPPQYFHPKVHDTRRIKWLLYELNSSS